ncbi:MAG TPA: beta-galactosidase [Propylenella sp.]
MLGVCYYPEHWPERQWPSDARRMREMGIGVARVGEFAWSRIEPHPGQIEWGWLDRALDLLGDHGLQIVLGTPTAAAPKWLVDRYPEILPVGPDGRVRGFGARRHYSFSSPAWWRESARIAEAMARRYGSHAAVIGWQIDNEYGGHDTAMSYGPEDLAAFRRWLRRRYGSAERLNEAWGNVFWSMEVRSFDEVPLPVGAIAAANPAAKMDYWRFTSGQVAAYNAMQAAIIRTHSPGRFVTHNFMGLQFDFDHWELGRELDLASWDSYPLGALERFFFSEEERGRLARTSHPDFAPFNHDLYRGIGRGRYWVMEQQPGPVNWAPWNPVPAPGMVRTWTWEALAHGAEVVSYFRWEQLPFGQEQMHGGLNRPDRVLTPGGVEAAAVGRELVQLGALPDTRQAPVALVLDYETSWFTRILPQGADFDYAELCFRWYEGVRRLGLDVDIVAPGAGLSGYRAVLVPSLACISEPSLQAFAEADAVILFGPRSGSKTPEFRIPAELPPGPLQTLLPLKVVQVASLHPRLREPVAGARLAGGVRRWREWLETDLEALAAFTDGAPALVGHGKRFYLAGWPEPDLLAAVLVELLERRAKLKLVSVPEMVRMRRRGDLTFAFNYGEAPWDLPLHASAEFLLGSPTLGAHDVACWRT